MREDKSDECSICLGEFKKKEKIARLGCLCVFHKSCIDDWIKQKPSCPNHPII